MERFVGFQIIANKTNKIICSEDIKKTQLRSKHNNEIVLLVLFKKNTIKLNSCLRQSSLYTKPQISPKYATVGSNASCLINP